MPKAANPQSPRVVERRSRSLSPWVSIETVCALMPGIAQPETYHGLRQADYITAMCLHRNGNVVLVRQYRPIVDRWTTEFPGGLCDAGETPASTAEREIEEETGLEVIETVALVETFADIGRLTNRCHGFFALVDGDLQSCEPGLEARFVPATEIATLAIDGGLDLAFSIALLYLSAAHPRVRAICRDLGLGEPPWAPRPSPGPADSAGEREAS